MDVLFVAKQMLISVLLVLMGIDSKMKMDYVNNAPGLNCKTCISNKETCSSCDESVRYLSNGACLERIQVSVSISGKAIVGEILTAALNNDDAKTVAQYSWLKSDTENGNFEQIGSENAESLSLNSDKNLLGKYIKVTVQFNDASNKYMGPVTSTPIGPIAEATENCVAGKDGCAVCSEGDNAYCTKCLDNYGYDSQYKTCTKCIEGETSDGTGPCTAISTGECSNFVQDCLECKSDKNKCSQCSPDFGLRGGTCTNCKENGLRYVDSYSPCLPQCPEGCSDDCFVENGKTYCERCSPGFHPDKENKACIKNIPEKCAYPFIFGCLKCEYAESYKCAECDESLNYKPEPNEYGGCECKDNFHQTGISCVAEEIFNCEVSDDQTCKVCGNDGKCFSCIDGYELKGTSCQRCPSGIGFNGLCYSAISCNTIDSNCEVCAEFMGEQGCIQCKEGYDNEYSDKCIPDNYEKVACDIKNCKSCYDYDLTQCIECNSDYYVYDGKCIPVNPQKVDCDVKNCKKCYEYDLTKCVECEDKYKLSKLNEGTCVCDDQYDEINGQCVEPQGPVIPEEEKQINIIVEGENKQVNLLDDDKTVEIIINLLKDEDDKQSLYNLDMNQLPQSEKVLIPQNDKKIQVTIPTNREIAIDSPSSVIAALADGATVKIPTSSKVSIKGSGDIQAEPGDDNGENVKIEDLIVIPGSSDSKSLKSEKGIIEINKLQIFGATGKLDITSKDGKESKITNLNIESGSKFDSDCNIEVANANVGLKSVMIIKTVTVKNFKVYYNTTSQSYDNIIPLHFEADSNTDSIERIDLDTIAQGETLEDGDELTIASFTSSEKCEEVSKKFKGGAEFDKATCDSKNNLVAKKKVAEADAPKPKDDSNKLSDGAIAGIVIACVVVVAVIVVLLVYFLVIKKKSQSTSSTQGDSSIAI